MEQLKYRVAPAANVRARMAELFASTVTTSVRLGRIELQPHQIAALSSVRRAIDEFGGALLADPVGTGKTYTALALVTSSETVLVVAPAALRDMWYKAAAVAEHAIVFVSFEALSRGASVSVESGFIIIDEAHHARNPLTRRYDGLSRLCSGRSVLLLSATPIHNREKDLRSLLSLFMGARATSLSSAEMARCVIRRSQLTRSLQAIPRADEVVWCRIATDDRIPSVLLDLPPPLPPRDGGDGGVLVVHSLIRQWTSSDAALIGGLRRRLARAEALISALEDGTWPSRSELTTWISGEDSIQLALPNFLAAPSEDSRSLLAVVRRHRDGLISALSLARQGRSDIDRAAVVRDLRSTHADRKIVVFSHYADTVDGMFMRLSRDGHVAALSGAGGRVAGGSISRREVIERFAPVATGTSSPRVADDVTLLITTDLLSEGVNLQDAGVVIHLDLPWTPARIEQRLGRLARLGSRHDKVLSFAFRPPANADLVIRIESILRRKLQDAGVVVESLPSFTEWAPGGEATRSAPLRSEALAELVRSWRALLVHDDDSCAAVAAVRAGSDGFLAVLGTGDDVRLVGCIDTTVTDDVALTLKCAQLAAGSDTHFSGKRVSQAHGNLMGWVQSSEALGGTRESSSSRSSARNKAARRIERAVRNAGLHERSAIIEKAGSARTLLARSLGVHDESELSELCDSDESDAVWLDCVTALGNRVPITARLAPPGKVQLLAMILLVAHSG